MSVELKINSDHVGLNSLMYLAEGQGPHPSVVFMHGYPGNERNLDVAQAVRRAGFNALFFNYRGSWGTGGTFSWENALEDGLSAVAFAKSAFAADSLRADTSTVYVFGHSFGGWVAATVAARARSVSGLAVMGTWNIGVTGQLMEEGV
jgi:pimeloyl-ACP methyl ester carboxylesterase